MMKVLVLGLDGATWKILDPLIKTGLLPSLEKITKAGASGTLLSTIPPITSPAWPSMATGLNPGKLGVFSIFRRYSDHSFSLRIVNSSVYRGRSVWDFLSEKGFNVLLFKIPFLYPVYKINGGMVSGFGSAGKFAAYPPDLYKKLSEGPSRLNERQLFNSLHNLDLNNIGACIAFVEGLKRIAQNEAEIILDILELQSWDFLFYVVSSTDWMQHAFMDKILELIKKIKSNSELEIIDKVLISFYRCIDSIVGKFLDYLAEKRVHYVLFIVSDHGFTVRPYNFNIARWLIKNQYMTIQPIQNMKKNSRRILSHIMNPIESLSRNYILGEIVEKFLKYLSPEILRLLGGAYLTKPGKNQISDYINFSESKIFCLEDNGIYINPLIKDKKSIIFKMKKALEKDLSRIPDLVLSVLESTEIYWGDRVHFSPDLILRLTEGESIWQITTDLEKPLIQKPLLSGIHDRNGIFVMYSPKIKQSTTFSKRSIFDICPTILNLFGIPKTKKMDGKTIDFISLAT